MERKKFLKKQSIANAILFCLEKTVDGYCRVEDFAYHHYRYHYGTPELEQSSLAQALRRLRLSGYIEKEIKQGQIVYKLTTIGKDFLGIEEKPWDGVYRIVLFDVPEEKRVIRDLFRRRLKDWDFKSWQRSVWVSKKNMTQKLRKLILELGIDKWVAVIEVQDKSLDYIFFNDRGE
ncbi:MAG: hypothetical protein Q7R82_00100 [Candidatus Daviesbacteria bacterium]|nr:hypothetical protein [Candidatus Daviesbacteria bacterium]